MAMPAFFKNTFQYNPIIIDAINDRIEKFLYEAIGYTSEIDGEKCKGTGEYRVLKNTSDDRAFRNRVEQTEQSHIILPFTNYRWTSIEEFTDYDQWTNFGYNQGLYCEELQAKIKYMPTLISFESTTWMHRNDDMFAMRKIIEKLRNRRKIKMYLDDYLLVLGEPARLPIFVEFEEPAIDKYSDVDWLEMNQINAVAHAFTVRYFDLVIDPDVYPVDKIIFTLRRDNDEPDVNDMQIIEEFEKL
jgi:hypothetical protein